MVHKRKPMPGGLKDSPPHWILRELRTRIHWVLVVLELCNQFATQQKGCQQHYATGTQLTYLTSELFSK